jgi:hypothetical protein
LSQDKIKYRSGYKHQLFEDYEVQTDIFPPVDIYTKHINLTTEGLLFIKQGYAWDGASGPTFDTKSSMRGSLVHDALYQLMRMGLLAFMWRYVIDKLLQTICVEDGMYRWRAWAWFKAVRWAAGSFALPENKREVHEAP